MSVCPVQSTPAGPRSPDRYGAAAWPLVCVKQRLPREVFRRSIAGLSDSRPTLRRLGYPIRRKTRFQPLVRRYWTGFDPQGFNERFLSASYISSSFPELCLAQSHRPRQPRGAAMKNLLTFVLVLAITPVTFACDEQVRGRNLARIRLRSGPTNCSPPGTGCSGPGRRPAPSARTCRRSRRR